MDPTSLADFQARYEANNDLTFAEFWEAIDKDFGRDASGQNKAAWRKVKLQISGKRLTLAEWRAFQSQFNLKKGRVDDRTEQDEYELIMAPLPPPQWISEVAKV